MTSEAMTGGELRKWWPWLRAVASRMAPAAHVDDVAQEGWVAMWQSAGQHNGSAPLDVWLKLRAHSRMCSAVRHLCRRAAREHYGVDIEVATDDQPSWQAYHAHEIAAALAALSPRQREYVTARFWEDKHTGELIELFGVEPSSIWRGARTKLHRQLSHLQSEER